MNRTLFYRGTAAAALALLICAASGFAGDVVQVNHTWCPAPACPAPACPAVEECAPPKVCQPVTGTKKVVKRVYSDKCEDFCVCHPTLCGGFFNLQEAIAKDHDCYDGACCPCGSQCGCPRVKKYLLIHNREHEECETKCQVVEGCAAAPACAGPVPGAPIGAPVPPAAPPMPKAGAPAALPTTQPLPAGTEAR